MKPIAIAAVVALLGCEPADIAPRTTAGYQENGVAGAIGGASGALLTTCRTLDGQTVRVAVDGLAAATGTGEAVQGIRAARRRACAAAGAVRVIGEGFAEQAPAATVHRRGDTAVQSAE